MGYVVIGQEVVGVTAVESESHGTVTLFRCTLPAAVKNHVL
jgi:hypothetical protein